MQYYFNKADPIYYCVLFYLLLLFLHGTATVRNRTGFQILYLM